MGRRSIVLLLTLAVLLQPALASACMAPCPMSPITTQKIPAASVNAHGMHGHHHAAMTDHSSASFASGACLKKMDLRSSALVAPIVSPAVATSEAAVLEAPSPVVAFHSRVLGAPDRFHAQIVVPLRI